MSLSSFCSLQSSLLSLEREEELNQSSSLREVLGIKELCYRGLALKGLEVVGKKTGLFGRTVVQLCSYQKEQGGNRKELSASSITTGDICGLYMISQERSLVSSGVVTSTSPTTITISFDEEVDIGDECLYHLVKLANDVTYKRLKNAIISLENEKRSTILKNCLFETSTLSPPNQSLPPAILKPGSTEEINFINDRLDFSQRAAVQFALLQRELAVIHGPPGTGKTTTVVEMISQAVRGGSKVLCCAPSNVAVDNLLERLARNKVKVVRLGHPARVHKDLQKYSLDAQISFSEQTTIVRDVRNDIDKAVSKLKKSRSKGEKAGISKDLRELRKELHERERDAMKTVLKNAEVVLATLTSGSPDGPLKHLPDDHFDMTVIDECSQSLELACWIVLPFARKTVLSGDHHQLPPTIMSEEAAKKGFALTLMERILKTFKAEEVVRMLQVQYRMNEKIMQWSSNALYEGRLIAHESVKEHLLKDLKGIQENEETAIPLVLIDTTGCDMPELQTSDQISKANEGEAKLVCLHVEKLIQSGLKPEEIAVITPYNLQVELIRLQLHSRYPTLEIRSVDGFQGREKEAVVLSLVRSNDKGEIGFLAEQRRLNVAVTRGRRHVAVICNVETVSRDKFLKGFVDYLEAEGEVRSAMQYDNELEAIDVVRPDGLEFTVNETKPEWEEQKASKKQQKARQAKKPKNETKRKEEIKKPQEDPAKDLRRRKFLPEMTEEEIEEKNDEKREEFGKIIGDFVNTNKPKHSFPATLNSHDRMIVHEIAEELGLIHESVGEGKDRRLVIRKKVEVKEKQVDEVTGGIEDLTVEDVEEPSDSNMVTCSTCQKQVPRSNIELHKMRCRPPTVQNDPKPTKETGTKKKKKKEKKSDKDEEEDFDSLIASFAKRDSKCKDCRAKLGLTGVTCEYCNCRFCIKHGLPEAHGCGDAAKRAARAQIGREGKLYAGSGVPSKLPDATRRRQLERRLQKNLNEKAEERGKKKKEKN